MRGYKKVQASGGPVDTALVTVGGRWGHRKSSGPPVGRVEPVERAGGIFSWTLFEGRCCLSRCRSRPTDRHIGRYVYKLQDTTELPQDSAGRPVTGDFAYWTVRLLFGHFAYWTFVIAHMWAAGKLNFTKLSSFGLLYPPLTRSWPNLTRKVDPRYIVPCYILPGVFPFRLIPFCRIPFRWIPFCQMLCKLFFPSFSF